jgi:single-stranded DNA-binding protein
MIDPKNLINITGGVVTDPELVNDKIAKFRLAVDYAGQEKGSENTSGYFDVVYYLKNQSGFVGNNASFIHGQISQSNLKKGTKLTIVGRLVQERWKQEDQNRSKIVIVAEHISYAASGTYSKSASSTAEPATVGAASVPDSF